MISTIYKFRQNPLINTRVIALSCEHSNTIVLFVEKHTSHTCSLLSSVHFCSTKATLVSSRMSYEIAEDMYKNSLQTNRGVLESSCMVLFLHCVEYFNITREKLLSSIDKDSTFEKSILNIDTRTIIRRSLIETQNWLRRKHSYWYGQMNDCLKVSFKPLKGQSQLKQMTIFPASFQI